MAEIDLRKVYKPMRFREFNETIDKLGIVSTYALDPVDREQIVIVDWHDVSLMVQHYEARIAELESALSDWQGSDG